MANPKLAVDEVADVADARRPVDPPAIHHGSRRAHADAPRLAAREQAREVQSHGRGEQPPRSTGGRVGELSPASGEDERERAQRRRRAEDGQRVSSARGEAAHARRQA